jgi:hypothetical protein
LPFIRTSIDYRRSGFGVNYQRCRLSMIAPSLGFTPLPGDVAQDSVRLSGAN